jgi:hypothetical protein
MTFSGRYEVTPQLQDEMMRQYIVHLVLWPRLVRIAVSLAVLGAVAMLDLPYRSWILGFISAVALLIVITWVRLFFQARAQGRAGLKLMEHPRVEVILDERQIVYSSSTGTRQHAWAKLDQLKETKDFVVLMAGKLPLLILPKSGFNAEALAFLHSSMRKTPPAL